MAGDGSGVGEVPEYAVFVGDLANDVTDGQLLDFFSDSYPSTCSAKVIKDATTKRPRGFGFVHFTSRADRDRAVAEMNGVQLSSRVIRVSLANGSGKSGRKGGSTRSSDGTSPSHHPADYDPTNTTLFVGGLSSCVTEGQLRDIFAKYGEIIYTKVPQGKGCGFVQFVDRWAAQMALLQMDGAVIANSAIRISWGRSSSKLSAALASGQPPNPMMLQPPSQAPYPPSWPAYTPLHMPGMPPAYPHQGGLAQGRVPAMTWMPYPGGPGAPMPMDPYFQFYCYYPQHAAAAAAVAAGQLGGTAPPPGATPPCPNIGRARDVATTTNKLTPSPVPQPVPQGAGSNKSPSTVSPWNVPPYRSRVRQYTESTSGGGVPPSFSTASTCGGGGTSSGGVVETEPMSKLDLNE